LIKLEKKLSQNKTVLETETGEQIE